MRFVNTLTLVAAFAATVSLTACGTAKEDKKTTTEDQAAVDAKADAALPTVIIAKVPVDADGNLLGDQAETVALTGDAASMTDAEAAFASGTSVSVTDELDQDSSSDQWHRGGRSGSYYWNTPWYPGKLLGRGLWWGRNPYAYYGGYSYGYNYGYSYNRPGCNYYVYNRGW